MKNFALKNIKTSLLTKTMKKQIQNFQAYGKFSGKILRDKNFDIYRKGILLAKLNIHKHTLLLSEHYSLLYSFYTDRKKCINIQIPKKIQIFLITKRYYPSTRFHEVIQNFSIVFVITLHRFIETYFFD